MASDQEFSVHGFAEELKALADATQVIQDETGGAKEQTYSLVQERSVSGLRTTTALKGVEVVKFIDKVRSGTGAEFHGSTEQKRDPSSQGLVRRERCAEMRTSIAARRLDRMEREQGEVDDTEHEASLQEALVDKTMVVKLVVDKWLVGAGFSIGKTPTSEIVLIHASVVRGAEVLTIGTVAWAQVVSDHARAEEGYRARKTWGQNAWRQEKDKEKANRVAQQVRRAAELTAELAGQSEKKVSGVRPTAGPS